MLKKIILPIAIGIICGSLISTGTIYFLEKGKAKAAQSSLKNQNSALATPQPQTTPTPIETSKESLKEASAQPSNPQPNISPETEAVRFLQVLFSVDPPNDLEFPESKQAVSFLTKEAQASLSKDTGGLAGFAKVEIFPTQGYSLGEVTNENNSASVKTVWRYDNREIPKAINMQVDETGLWKINSID